MPERIPKVALQEVLDDQIALWRKRMDQAVTDYAVDTAGHYIDAYQYIRELFIGGQLSVEDEE